MALSWQEITPDCVNLANHRISILQTELFCSAGDLLEQATGSCYSPGQSYQGIRHWPARTACNLCTYFYDPDRTRLHLTTSHLAACGVYWVFTMLDAVGLNRPVSLCALLRQAGASKKAGMTADQVAIIARLKANNAQLNLRPELQGMLLLSKLNQDTGSTEHTRN